MGKFADSVDPSSFTVLDPPDYVFLCGGQLEDLEHSLRAQFYARKIKTDPNLLGRVQLSESANKWYRAHEHFEDLLELEEYLAGLSACILLFVESPGAIAELGAFTQMVSLREKLILVLEQFYEGKPSFILDGPIKFATRSGFGRVLWYPWLIDPAGSPPFRVDPAALDDTLDAIAETLLETLANRPRTCAFQSGDHGHRMLLIADLVKLSVVCHESEIQGILTELGINCESGTLTKYLYLLSKLGLIATEKYGHIDYFFCGVGTPDHIKYAPKTPADRMKLAGRLREDLPMSVEKKRAYDAHIRRTPGAAR